MADEIVVNGKVTSVDWDMISYEDVCEFAGKDPQTLPTAVFSCRGQDGDISGALIPGNSVRLRPGMRFTVIHTGNA